MTRCSCRSECGESHGVARCHHDAIAFKEFCVACQQGIDKRIKKLKPVRQSPRMADEKFDELPLFGAKK
jgi:hypothetical protein